MTRFLLGLVIEPVIKPMAYSKPPPPNTACRFGAGFWYSAMQRVQKSMLATSLLFAITTNATFFPSTLRDMTN